MLSERIHFSCFHSSNLDDELLLLHVASQCFWIMKVECIYVCIHSCQCLVSQLGGVMVSMASNLMLADERVLWMAQREAMACSRIIACLQKIAVYRLAKAQAFSLVSPLNNTMGPIFVAAALRRFGIFPTLKFALYSTLLHSGREAQTGGRFIKMRMDISELHLFMVQCQVDATLISSTREN